MSQPVAILVMLNNYVHDVATGLLVISALWIGWSARDLSDTPGAEALALFRSLYSRSVRFVGGSVGVIIATGIVRTVYFMEFEWQSAMGRGLVPVLLLKHVLIFTMVGLGLYAWRQLRRRLRQIPGWM